MGAYRLSRKAAADVEGIYTYTMKQHGLTLARKYLDGLHTCFEHLAEHPMLGRRADRIAPGVRRHECQSHVVLGQQALESYLWGAANRLRKSLP